MDSAGSLASPIVSTRDSRYGRIAILCIGLLIATLWLATRPYRGVIEDSRFYTVQALNALMPGRFAADLYFQFGSQDRFTIFSWIYAPFLSAFGIAGGNIILLLCGQLCWLSGIVYFARAIIRSRNGLVLAIVAAIVLPGGAPVMMRYGEPSLTPRLFAEALTFWALGAMLRGSTFRALLLFCVTSIVHPIMTLPGLTALFIFEARKRPILWAVAAIGAIVVVGLALSGVRPFAGLTETFDPTWFAVVQERDSFCLPTQWSVLKCLQGCNIIALTALVISKTPREERQIPVILLIIALGGIALSLVGDLTHHVLLVDMQPWRATWLLSVVINLFVGPMLARIPWRPGSSGRLATSLIVLALGLLALSEFIPLLYVISAPTILVAWLVSACEDARQRPTPGLARIAVLASIGAALGASLLLIVVWIVSAATIQADIWRVLGGLSLTMVALGLIGLHLANATQRTRYTSVPAFLSVSIVLFALAILNWDQRMPWTKFIDTTESPPATLLSLLPGDSPIYWEDVTVPWFLLKRPSYFSCDQGTGALFSRGTAVNYGRRSVSLGTLRTLDFGRVFYCPAKARDSTAALTRDDVTHVCTEEPSLGALVLVKPVANVAARIWESPVTFQDVASTGGHLYPFSTDRFFIYTCDDFRERK
jgi:hypothetical protein